MAAVLKTAMGRELHRGFESHTLRQPAQTGSDLGVYPSTSLLLRSAVCSEPGSGCKRALGRRSAPKAPADTTGKPADSAAVRRSLSSAGRSLPVAAGPQRTCHGFRSLITDSRLAKQS